MQVTIDIPEELARRLASKPEDVTEVIERGLGLSASTGLAQELAEFLAKGPQPQDIIGFRPSDASVRRIDELFEKSRQGPLSSEDKAELDEIMQWNRVFSLIKAQARIRLQPA